MSPQKWPIARKQNFFWGGPNGKVVAPGIMVICPADKNCNYQTKNWILAPNIQIFGSKKHIFVPSGQVELYQSMFSSRKRYLIGSLIWGSFAPSPQIRIFGQKRPNCAKTDIFCQISSVLVHLIQCPTKKQFKQVALVVFYYVRTKTFTLLSKNRDFGPKKSLLLDSNHVLARNRKKC